MITVAIDRFDGPLDLLLALVRRNQYPLDALPIAEITRQYLAYLKEASGADVELGADFLETASWLVLLKSRAMLPQAPGEEAPSLELERAPARSRDTHENGRPAAQPHRCCRRGTGKQADCFRVSIACRR